MVFHSILTNLRTYEATFIKQHLINEQPKDIQPLVMFSFSCNTPYQANLRIPFTSKNVSLQGYNNQQNVMVHVTKEFSLHISLGSWTYLVYVYTYSNYGFIIHLGYSYVAFYLLESWTLEKLWHSHIGLTKLNILFKFWLQDIFITTIKVIYQHVQMEFYIWI